MSEATASIPTDLTLDMTGILIDSVQKLSLARNIHDVMDIVKVNARKLTQADGVTFILSNEGACYYVDEDSVAPLWKGRRFPMSTCVSGWVMQEGTPEIIEDVSADERIPNELYQSTYVKSMCMVPIRNTNPMGAIGNYWSYRHLATKEQVKCLQLLANATAVVIENINLMNTLEQRVEERTRELAVANSKLAKEIAEKERAEEEVRRLSMEDYMTGLHNRRGFFQIANEAFKLAKRENFSYALLYADINNLKQCNDWYGHEAGDELICFSAQILSQTFRDVDVIARMGGDEFAVFAVDVKEPDTMKMRLERAIQEANKKQNSLIPLSMSTGLIVSQPDDHLNLQQLVRAADQAMYAYKRANRSPEGI